LEIREIGYLPFGRAEANLFLNMIAKRYEVVCDQYSNVLAVVNRICKGSNI
jgi:DNA replication protein DnaC